MVEEFSETQQSLFPRAAGIVETSLVLLPRAVEIIETQLVLFPRWVENVETSFGFLPKGVCFFPTLLAPFIWIYSTLYITSLLY